MTKQQEIEQLQQSLKNVHEHCHKKEDEISLLNLEIKRLKWKLGRFERLASTLKWMFTTSLEAPDELTEKDFFEDEQALKEEIKLRQESDR